MSTGLSFDTTITPKELHDRLRRGDPITVIDVREPIEYQVARLDCAELIPLAQLASRVDGLDRSVEYVVVCHHGIRSQYACDFLASSGFDKVRNLTGGIDRWSVEVDPAVPRY
jgi:rhodanese-related sulfurtransferase